MRKSKYIYLIVTISVILGITITAILWPSSANKSLSIETGILTQLKSTSQNNNTAELVKGVNIALVEPTFTYAAYHKAFYTFYAKISILQVE